MYIKNNQHLAALGSYEIRENFLLTQTDTKLICIFIYSYLALIIQTLTSFKVGKLHVFSLKEGSAEREVEELYSLLVVTVIIVVHPMTPRPLAKPSRLCHGSVLTSILLKFRLSCCKFESPKLPLLKAHSLRIWLTGPSYIILSIALQIYWKDNQ